MTKFWSSSGHDVYSSNEDIGDFGMGDSGTGGGSTDQEMLPA